MNPLFKFNRTNIYYYNRFFAYSEVKQEAVDNTNIELSSLQLNELTESQLNAYLEYRFISLEDAARHGCLKVTKCLMKNSISYTNVNRIMLHNIVTCENAIISACENGYLSIVKYLCSIARLVSSMRYTVFGVMQDKYDIIIEEPTMVNKKAVEGASANGHIEIVRYLVEKRKIHIDEDVITFARCNGHTEIVKYLIEIYAHLNNPMTIEHII